MEEENQTQQQRSPPKPEGIQRPKKGTSAKRKGGQDRRMAGKVAKAESNMYTKMEGKEVPKTLRVRKLSSYNTNFIEHQKERR